MTKRRLLDRCLTGDRWVETTRELKLRHFNELCWFLLFDRCLTGEAQAVEKRIMGLSLGQPWAATVEDSLSVKNGGRRRPQRGFEPKRTAADEIAELQKINKQPERKKDRR